MNLTVVIPTHKRLQDILKLIESLKAQDLASLQVEVYVVSNLSDLSLKTRLREAQKELSFPVYYLEVGKIGVNAARNLGVRHSTSEKIYFLDDDVFLTDKNHLWSIYNMAQQNPWAAALGGGYILPESVPLIDEVYHAICTSWLKKGHQNMVGGNTLYNLKILAGNLKFNEQITFGGSETELNLKLQIAGNKFLFSDSLSLLHSTHLNVFSFAKKALRQGMGRSIHEEIVPLSYWKVDTVKSELFFAKNSDKKMVCLLAGFYFSLYDFFFHVGYRHGKRQNNGQLSKMTVCICMFQTFFQINSDKILFVPNPAAIPFHRKSFPALKFNELRHWFRAHVWWRIPNFIFWKIIPAVGNKFLNLLEKTSPLKSVKIRNYYYRLFKKL